MAEIGNVGAPQAEMPQDQAMAQDVEERSRYAGARAAELEQDARRWRNVEAACYAALEQLNNGFRAQDELGKVAEAPPVEAIDPASLRI